MIKEMSDFNIIKYYRELLIKAVPASSSIDQCVLKSWLSDLGQRLEFDSMRLFMFDDIKGSFIARHIFGDKEIWKGFDITQLRKEITVYKKLFFIKIRHIRENGQFLVLGYLGFYTRKYVSLDLLNTLDVLCILYGNHIVKRLNKGKLLSSNEYINKIFSLAASRELPGTKILGIIDSLRHLSCFNTGVYYTYYDGIAIAEYLASSRSTTYIKKPFPWKLSSTIIDAITTSYNCFDCRLDYLSRNTIQFLLYNDNRAPNQFYTNIYPVFVDSELIGFWLFCFSKNNPFNYFNIKDLLDNIYGLLFDSYKFLFQRRFSKMVVNPIFQNRDTRINEDSVFVIMPFSEDWSNDIWEQIIKPAVKEIGMTPIRADNLYGQNIMEDIWQSILKAKIIICDTTGRNPNVFYELGIAHTLGKQVLLLTQNVNDIPFDLQAYRHIEYNVSISGGNQLKETIKRHLEETLKQQ